MAVFPPIKGSEGGMIVASFDDVLQPKEKLYGWGDEERPFPKEPNVERSRFFVTGERVMLMSHPSRCDMVWSKQRFQPTILSRLAKLHARPCLPRWVPSRSSTFMIQI